MEKQFERLERNEILKLGARGWKKGKVRICVEFSPEEPEYPLEDLAELLE